jgi:hypothetical protein
MRATADLRGRDRHGFAQGRCRPVSQSPSVGEPPEGGASLPRREKGADGGLGSRALAAGPHHGMVQAATLSLSGCASSLILKTAGTMAVTSACTETEGRDVQASCYDSGRAAAALRSFRRHYNEERPHDALRQMPPGTHWRPPARAMPACLENPWYDANHEVRCERWNGMIKWKGRRGFHRRGTGACELIGLAEHPAAPRLRKRAVTERLTEQCRASARSNSVLPLMSGDLPRARVGELHADGERP